MSHSKILIPLIFSILLFAVSFQKVDKGATHSKLTIEKAKDLFSRTGVRDFEVHSRGGEENDDDYAISMTLGWNNGSEYHDVTNNLDVIELPILHSNLLKTFDVVSDGDESNGYANNGQKEILLVTQGTDGIVNFTILKISGTTDYLATHNMSAVSYKSLGPNFKGMAQYYNLKDSLLEGYLFNRVGAC